MVQIKTARQALQDRVLRPAARTVERSTAATVQSGLLRWLHLRGCGPIRVVLPDGAVEMIGQAADGRAVPTLTIHDCHLFARIVRDGIMGIGEGYVAGEWSGDPLVDVLTALGRNHDRVLPPWLFRSRAMYQRLRRGRARRDVTAAQKNVQEHYELPTEMFRFFLDETMTYSCGIFEDGDDLEHAQLRKYRATCELAKLRKGQHVLDLGAGWGGFALFAAREYGCRVTGTTPARNQKEYIERLALDAGLADQVDVVLTDYRLLTGSYDAIVSIEMIEHVGREYLPAFFAACDRLLVPGGNMVLQSITLPHKRYLLAGEQRNWVEKHIFPGGFLPSVPALREAMTASSQLRVFVEKDLSEYYAGTLRAWRERFMANQKDVAALGFDQSFIRKWEFYFAICETGYHTGQLGDVQLLLRRNKQSVAA